MTNPDVVSFGVSFCAPARDTGRARTYSTAPQIAKRRIARPLSDGGRLTSNAVVIRARRESVKRIGLEIPRATQARSSTRAPTSVDRTPRKSESGTVLPELRPVSVRRRARHLGKATLQCDIHAPLASGVMAERRLGERGRR